MILAAGQVIEICLPTFHVGQIRAFDTIRHHKLVAGRCGRRWGKTDFAKIIACDGAVKGRNIGWFAPNYRILSEAYAEIIELLTPVIVSSSKTEGVIRVRGGGRMDFWTLENDRAGRSRKYHLVVIDEAAFAKDNMTDIWEKAIRPTLLDYADKPYGGRCLAISNTNGISEDNFFHKICTQPRYGFSEFHARTHENPYLPKAELAKLEAENHPLVYQQEYLAEFVDWSGVAFFSLDRLLLDGVPVPYPYGCDSVLAVIDTAVKTGQEHDATAALFVATMPDWFGEYRLVLLDWDLVQIEGALLETWMPAVYARLEELSKECKARFGSIGAYIEDAQSGAILLQQCALRGFPAEALPPKLTKAGKDTRAINASGPVYRGEVKLSRYAYEKTVTYKATTRNHLVTQVVGFRIGDKEAAKRADDLLDCFTYAVAITLGGSEGIA